MEQNEPHYSGHPISASYRANFKAALELEDRKNEIKQAWETKVRSAVSSSHGYTSLALRNTLGTFLDELAAILKQDLPPDDELLHKGMAKIHGGERAKFSGYFLPQLLKEFSILREVLNATLHRKELLTYGVRSCIDKAIDTVISIAATEFSDVQHAATKAALLKSESSNLDLERFASVAAHDLKSPLATISGYLNLLDEEFTERLGEEGVQFVRLMIGASQRMRNLIDSLLEYSRLTNTKKPFQPTNMNQVVKSALQNLDSVIAETKAEVTYTQLPVVQGDADLLTQLFQNLIANSIKFHGSESPRISIDVEDKNGAWYFSLKDNGIGFSSKQSDEIFILYKKLHGDSQYQGSGIGLASCRKVVELHGGKIWADSKPGIGSTFYFLIPKSKNESDVVN